MLLLRSHGTSVMEKICKTVCDFTAYTEIRIESFRFWNPVCDGDSNMFREQSTGGHLSG